MEPGKQRSIQSMEEARDWERLFIFRNQGGPRPSSTSRPAEVTRCRASACRRLPRRVHVALRGARRAAKPPLHPEVVSRCSRRTWASSPLDALEEPDAINAFKIDSDYAEEVEIATVHRALETLRAAMNWAWPKRRLSSRSRRSTAREGRLF